MDRLNIYVGNLEQSVEKSDLMELFSEFSPTDAIIKGRTLPDGTSRRFAFVNVPEEFKDIAIKKLNGAVLKGQNILVDNARFPNRHESLSKEVEGMLGLKPPSSWANGEKFGNQRIVGGKGTRESYY
jgi:RNA recognition motif-containing protein